MDKKLLITLISTCVLVLSSGSLLVAKGIKDNKKTNTSSSSQGVLTQSGIYLCANGGTLSKLGNFDSSDPSVTTLIEYTPNGDKYIDFSLERYIPTRKGYTFGGWFTSPTLENDSKIDGLLKVEDEIKKLYAYWKEEDKPSLYGYTLTSSYVSLHGFSSYDPSAVYKLHIPSYIEGYPVHYISNTNEYKSFGQTNVYEVILPSNLKYIYGNTFTNSNIENIVIPSSVYSIGSNAFSSCKSLKNVEIGNQNPSLKTISSYAFYNSASLESINIPTSVTTIGDGAFKNCTSLVNILIPSSVNSIGKELLKGTEAEKNLLVIDGFVFINDSIVYEYKGEESNIIIPEQAGVLSNSLFENNNSIVSVDFSKSTSLKKINSSVFRGCKSLSNDIVLPSSIEDIGSYAFKDVPANIDASKCSFIDEALPSSCFEGSLAENISIPYWIKTIKSYAFRNCSSLTSVNIPSSLISIQSSAFNGCSSLKNIILPESVTTLQQSAFANCTSLISFTLPANITSIPASLFEGCTSLLKIKLNTNITSIGNMAFKGCSNISSLSIELGPSFSYIGNRVFEGWESNQTIEFKGVNLKKLNEKNKPSEYTIEGEKVLCAWDYGCKANVKFI